MSDERAKELVSAAADDQVSDTEREELERLLETSPEAREFAQDLARLESLLERVPDEDPPEGLREGILNRIPAAKRDAEKGRSWLGSVLVAPVVRYSLAATAGILLTVSVYETQRPMTAGMDITELVGTMTPDATRGSRDLLASHRFHADGVESRIELERRDGALLLDIRVDAARPVDIAVDFSAAGMRLDALAQLNGAVESIQIADDIMRLRVRGRRTLAALLHNETGRPRPDTPSIRLEFSSDDEQQTRELLVPAW